MPESALDQESSLPAQPSGRLARSDPGRDFWLLWVISTSVAGFFGAGIVVGSVVLLSLSEYGPLSKYDPNHVANSIILFAILGGVLEAPVGFAQALVLRRYLRNAIWWFLASLVAGLVGGALTSLPSPMPAVPFIALLPLPALVGLAQWLVLKRQLKRAGWWIAATILAWLSGALQFAAVSDLETQLSHVRALELVFSGLGPLVGNLCLTSIVVSGLTGGTLLWLFQLRKE